jgi:hypothetical protein
MKGKIAFLSLAILMFGFLSGCAFTTTQIKVDYTPSHYSKITDATKTIEVKRFNDTRGVDPKLIAQKYNQYGKTTGKYVSEREVADIVTEAVQNLLSNLNYRILNDNGELIFGGEILKCEQNVLMGFWSGELEGNIQVNLRLIEANSGNILWNEVISGYGKKTGLQLVTADDYKEVFEKTLDNLMKNVANSTTFKTIVEKKSLK